MENKKIRRKRCHCCGELYHQCQGCYIILCTGLKDKNEKVWECEGCLAYLGGQM